MWRQAERDSEFVAFVEQHRGMLVGAARLLRPGDEAAAEDLVQATLTKLYVKWPQVRRADNVVGYARRALTNTFIDEAERAHRRRETSVADIRDDSRVEDADIGLRAIMIPALQALPPGQRAVVVMRHWFDLDVAQTATALGCSSGTVKSQNAKALDALRRRLDAAVLAKE